MHVRAPRPLSRAIPTIVCWFLPVAAATAAEPTDSEHALQRLAQPIEDVPFATVVRALTGRRIIPLDAESDAALLVRLRRAMSRAAERAHHEGLRARRPNEAGNAIEVYVKSALRDEGFAADVPRTSSGRRQAAGYPDVQVTHGESRTIYLEVKTYQRRTANTTQRSFYFSPTAHSKILVDANHVLVGFEMVRERDPQGQVFRPVAWRLVDLSSLRVRLKYEFNASNRQIYGKGKILGEEALSALGHHPE